MTRVRVEPRSFDQGRGKNDAFTHLATLPTWPRTWRNVQQTPCNFADLGHSVLWRTEKRKKSKRGVVKV